MSKPKRKRSQKRTKRKLGGVAKVSQLKQRPRKYIPEDSDEEDSSQKAVASSSEEGSDEDDRDQEEVVAGPKEDTLCLFLAKRDAPRNSSRHLRGTLLQRSRLWHRRQFRGAVRRKKDKPRPKRQGNPTAKPWDGVFTMTRLVVPLRHCLGG